MRLRATAGQLARLITPTRLRARAAAAQLELGPHGYDAFGMSRDGVAFGAGLSRWLYEAWFRVRSHGAENLPNEGAAILACNHSGTLPLDGLMLWADVLRNTEPPRVARIVTDHFVAGLPWVGTIFERAGAFGGSRGNTHALLSAGQLVGVFPEGVRGIGKPFSERYRLQRWTEGHAEMAIRHRIPVVPVAVVGAEEQMPQLARIPIRLFGSPYIPVTATPFPLPVRYHIYYGAPLHLYDGLEPDAANDPDVVSAAATRTRDAVAALIARGLSERRGVFA